MCENEKKGRTVKNAAVRGIGIVLCITVIVLRLCGSYIGGAFEEFSDAAFPWLIIGIAVAVVLSFSSVKEEKTIEKQNTGIEKKS